MKSIIHFIHIPQLQHYLSMIKSFRIKRRQIFIEPQTPTPRRSRIRTSHNIYNTYVDDLPNDDSWTSSESEVVVFTS
jgi:hypothetical protein